MTPFAPAIHQYWQTPFQGHTAYSDAHLQVIVNPDLDVDEAVTILHTVSDALTRVALLPSIAQALHSQGILSDNSPLTKSQLREALHNIGIAMHGADHVFYVPNNVRETWLQEPEPQFIRQLTQDDAMRFAELEYQTSDQELDQAQVALDDWAVFGVLDENNALLSAASIYPWGNDSIVDIGVLTLAAARGKGHATRLIRAVGRYAMTQHYELQYRSQANNPASLALAEASGLALLGYWEIPTPSSQE